MQIKYLTKEKIKIYYSPAGHYPYLDQNLKKTPHMKPDTAIFILIRDKQA